MTTRSGVQIHAMPMMSGVADSLGLKTSVQLGALSLMRTAGADPSGSLPYCMTVRAVALSNCCSTVTCPRLSGRIFSGSKKKSIETAANSTPRYRAAHQ